MDLSIIIVNWNTKKLLLKCLQSLIHETNNYQTEIIVIDNASTDGSVEAVHEKFHNIKVIRNIRNLGFAKANNIGIEESSGQYVCLINSDVMVLNGCLDSMFNYMEQNPSIGMLGPKMLYPDLTFQLSCKKFPTLWNNFCVAMGLHTIFPRSRIFSGEHMYFLNYNIVRRIDVIAGAFWMVRRDALDQVGLLDENFFFYAEDIDWCKRFWAAGWEVVFFPGAQAIHYHEGSSSNEPIKFYIEQRRAKLQYWKKYHGKLVLKGISAIMLLHQIIRITGNIILYIIKSSKRKNISQKIKRSFECTRWLLHMSKKYN